MKRSLGSRLIDVLCGFLAYTVARIAWGRRESLANFHLELLTFAVVYLLLQGILRGWRLAREGKRA
jgi:hypothetical protein